MNTFFPYVGSKRVVRDKILYLINECRKAEYNIYAEPFMGSASIFFAIDNKFDNSILNDINSELVNLFQVVQNNYDEFIEAYSWNLYSEKLFNIYKDEFKRYGCFMGDNITRAVKYYFILLASWYSIGGIRKSFFRPLPNAFNKNSEGIKVYGTAESKEYLKLVRDRLQNVSIRNMDAVKFIKKQDCNNTIMFIDPPYYHRLDREKEYYTVDGVKDDEFHLNLLDCLKGLKMARFILTYEDSDIIREMYKDFYIKELQFRYLLTRNEVMGKELIIINFQEGQTRLI